jgi:hypothetical protein
VEEPSTASKADITKAIVMSARCQKRTHATQ